MNKAVNARLMHIYDLMYSRIGTRSWWPADSDFEMIVGAILTQFVSWKNVIQAINNLKEENLLSTEGICNVEESKLEELIKCTRFYKQKAKKLKTFCFHVRDKYDGILERFLDNELNKLRSELLSLYGIGKETTDCIILYAAKKPIFVVDAYTRRVFGKLGFFNDKTSYDEMQVLFMKNLVHEVQLFNEYHAQIDGIGSHFCYGKNPNCTECPLDSVCKH